MTDTFPFMSNEHRCKNPQENISQLNSTILKKETLRSSWGFPGGAVVKNPPGNAGDTGWTPGPGRFHMLRSK